MVYVKYSYAEDLCFDAMLWVHHVLQKKIKTVFASNVFITVTR